MYSHFCGCRALIGYIVKFGYRTFVFSILNVEPNNIRIVEWRTWNGANAHKIVYWLFVSIGFCSTSVEHKIRCPMQQLADLKEFLTTYSVYIYNTISGICILLRAAKYQRGKHARSQKSIWMERNAKNKIKTESNIYTNTCNKETWFKRRETKKSIRQHNVCAYCESVLTIVVQYRWRRSAGGSHRRYDESTHSANVSTVSKECDMR